MLFTVPMLITSNIMRTAYFGSRVQMIHPDLPLQIGMIVNAKYCDVAPAEDS